MNPITSGSKDPLLSTPKEVKALLLGTSESGKSTILKALKLRAKGAYTEKERLIQRKCFQEYGAGHEGHFGSNGVT